MNADHELEGRASAARPRGLQQLQVVAAGHATMASASSTCKPTATSSCSGSTGGSTQPQPSTRCSGSPRRPSRRRTPRSTRASGSIRCRIRGRRRWSCRSHDRVDVHGVQQRREPLRGHDDAAVRLRQEAALDERLGRHRPLDARAGRADVWNACVAYAHRTVVSAMESGAKMGAASCFIADECSSQRRWR